MTKHNLTKKVFLALISLGFTLAAPNIAVAHGGRLDSQGGHYCRVGKCAGTYHCHQALGPVCGGPSSKKKK